MWGVQIYRERERDTACQFQLWSSRCQCHTSTHNLTRLPKRFRHTIELTFRCADIRSECYRYRHFSCISCLSGWLHFDYKFISVHCSHSSSLLLITISHPSPVSILITHSQSFRKHTLPARLLNRQKRWEQMFWEGSSRGERGMEKELRKDG